MPWQGVAIPPPPLSFDFPCEEEGEEEDWEEKGEREEADRWYQGWITFRAFGPHGAF